MMNQSHIGNQKKQGRGKCKGNRNKSYVRTDNEGFGGQCENLIGYNFDCGIIKHAKTYHQYTEELFSYFSFNFKEIFCVSQAEESESKYFPNNPVKLKGKNQVVEQYDGTVTMQEVDTDEI